MTTLSDLLESCSTGGRIVIDSDEEVRAPWLLP